jgi:hypothetical protein
MACALLPSRGTGSMLSLTVIECGRCTAVSHCVRGALGEAVAVAVAGAVAVGVYMIGGGNAQSWRRQSASSMHPQRQAANLCVRVSRPVPDSPTKYFATLPAPKFRFWIPGSGCLKRDLRIPSCREQLVQCAVQGVTWRVSAVLPLPMRLLVHSMATPQKQLRSTG